MTRNQQSSSTAHRHSGSNNRSIRRQPIVAHTTGYTILKLCAALILLGFGWMVWGNGQVSALTTDRTDSAGNPSLAVPSLNGGDETANRLPIESPKLSSLNPAAGLPLQPDFSINAPGTLTPTATVTPTVKPSPSKTTGAAPAASATPSPSKTASTTPSATSAPLIPTPSATGSLSTTPQATITTTATITRTRVAPATATQTRSITPTRTATLAGARGPIALQAEADIDSAVGGELNGENGAIVVDFPANMTANSIHAKINRNITDVHKDDRQRAAVFNRFVVQATDKLDLTKPVTQFKKPITITVKYDTKTMGIAKERTLTLAYWDAIRKNWQALPSRVDTKLKTVTAITSHFTDFGLTESPDVSSYLPTLQGFQTDLFTSASTASFQLEVPPGRGGLAPRLTLDYSSGSVEMMDNYQQASYVGAGWNLGSSYIARDTRGTYDSSDDAFTLVLNGAGYDLVPDAYDSTRYHTANENYWFIKRNTIADTWVVTTTDGTGYSFGVSANSKATMMRYDFNWNQKWEPYEWALQQVVDTHNNQINYTYQHVVSNTLPGGCAFVNSQTSWDLAIMPQVIQYNNGANTQIGFFYSPRNDYNWYWTGQCSPAPQQTKKLDRVDISTTVSGTLQLVRQYRFNYDYSTFPGVYFNHADGTPWNYGRLSLKSVTQYGTDAASQNAVGLPPYAFTYDKNRIKTAANGIGATTTYTYDVASAGGTDAIWNVSYWAVAPPESCPTDNGWSGNGAAVEGAAGDGFCYLHVYKTADPGYVYRNVGNFVPGTTYTFAADVFWNGGNANDRSVKLTAYDGTTEYTVTNWIYSPGGVYSQHISGTFTSTDNGGGSSLELRIYTQNSAPISAFSLQLMNTRHRVTSKSVDDGNGGVSTYNYGYSGIAVNDTGHSIAASTSNPLRRPGWEFRGHEAVTITNPAGNKTENHFGQDDIYAGRALTITQMDSANNKYTRVLNTYGAQCIDVIQWLSAISSQYSCPPNAARPTPSAPTPGNYDDTDASITYNGGWSTWTGSGPYNGTFHYSQTPGNSAGFTYYGTQFSIVYGIDPNQGVLNVSLDGQAIGTINEYAGTLQWQQSWTYNSGPLSLGTHTVTLTHASGSMVNLDAIQVAALPQPVTGNRSNFVYLSSTTRQTWDGAASNPTSQQTKYTYIFVTVTVGSGGFKMPGIAQADEYSDAGSTLYRSTVYSYTLNTSPSAWIVDKVNIAQVKDLSGNRASETHYYYDSYGISTTVPISGELRRVEVFTDTINHFRSISNTLDGWGNVTLSDDASSHRTTTTMDGTYHIYPTNVTNALNQATTYTYDLRLGRLLTTTDPNGATTSHTYDVFGRTSSIKLVLEQASSNASVLYTYSLGNPRSMVNVQVRSDLGGTNPATYQNAWWFYDGQGRVIQRQTQSLNAGQIILVNTSYNNLGQLHRTSNPYNASASGGTYQSPDWTQPVTAHAYDPVGREVTTTNPDGTTQAIAYNQWTTTITDTNGHQRVNAADAFGRTVIVLEKNQGSTYQTTYTYDTLSHLKYVTDTLGNGTTLNYDSLGRKTSMTDPDMGTWNYGYDQVGNLIRQTDALSQTICFYYDPLNRLKGKNYQTNNTTCLNDPGSNYTVWNKYDEATSTNGIGRRTVTTDTTGTTHWNYDMEGNVLTSTKSILPAGKTYTTSWTYDVVGRARSMNYPDGEQVTTTFNNQGQLATLSSYVRGANYGASGQLLSMSLGSGMTTTYSYDSQNLRLIHMTTAPSGGSTIQDFTYQYDNIGNINAIVDSSRVETSTFGYDDLNRMLTATIPNVYTRTWSYNAIGNITQRVEEGTQTGYIYDLSHKHAVTQTGQLYFCYDASGNMTRRAMLDVTCSSGGDSLSYDAENRLTQVLSNTNGITTAYSYDGGGARVTKTVTASGTTTNTYYIGNYYEVTVSGGVTTTTKYYYYGAQRIAMSVNGTVTYLYSDHLGGSNVTTDANGGNLKRRIYYPFGGVRPSSDNLATDYGFTGQRLDLSNGLMYYGARYYDAALGRFIQADTIVPNGVVPQSLNRYTYALNNPVRLVDPSGHCPKPTKEDGDVVCIDFFIPTTWSEGPPGTTFYGDGRWFSAESSSDPKTLSGGSRAWIWIDAKTGQKIASGIHQTCVVDGGCTAPRSQGSMLWENYLNSTPTADGFRVDYGLVCSGRECIGAPRAEGDITFTRNAWGKFDISMKGDAFPNPEAYLFSNRELKQMLFGLNFFTDEERRNDKSGFGLTLIRMSGGRTFDLSIKYITMTRYEATVTIHRPGFPDETTTQIIDDDTSGFEKMLV